MLATKAFFICLLHIFAIHISTATCNDDLDSVKIIYYYGPTYNDYKEYDLKNVISVLQHPMFIHKQTTLYMPGYTNEKHGPDTRLAVDSYFKRNTTNFLKLDWEELANGSYISAQQNVLKLSPRVADSIIRLFRAGLDRNTFSLFGLSMGARGISVIGKNVLKRSNGRMLIARITPLDPSNEEAHEPFILPLIEKSHAKFVDIIHTDAGGMGTTKNMGHANFWPNNGTAIQPGCQDKNIDSHCDHRKALAYWLESVAKADIKRMLAFRSGSYANLLKNGADNYMDTSELMGIDCPSSVRGVYYLQLNSTYGDYYVSYVDK